jgi:nucleoside-diphosphate-sugar epimerase
MPTPQPRPKRCLITGASGFIGTRLCERLAAGAAQDFVRMVRNPALAGPQAVVADLLQPAQVAQALQGCDAVIHLAHGDRGPQATRTLVDAAMAQGVQRFVYTSTMSVHGPAPGPEAAREETARIGRYDHDYSDSKAEQEEIVQAACDRGDLAAVILRPTVVYGPRGVFVQQIVEQALAGEVTLFDQGRGICNAVYVDDVCDAIDASLTRDEALGQAMFINADEPVSWGEFIHAFAGLVEPAPRYVELSSAEALRYWAEHPPQQAHGLLPRAMNKLKRMAGWRPPVAPWPPLGRVMRETFPIAFANDKAKRLLGWAPRVDFAQGVALTAQWLRAEGPLAR